MEDPGKHVIGRGSGLRGRVLTLGVPLVTIVLKLSLQALNNNHFN